MFIYKNVVFLPPIFEEQMMTHERTRYRQLAGICFISLFLLHFVGYVFFSHSHLVGNQLIVHTHATAPFDQKQHHHTQGELAQIFSLSQTVFIVPVPLAVGDGNELPLLAYTFPFVSSGLSSQFHDHFDSRGPPYMLHFIS